MFAITPTTRVFLRAGVTDMRLGFHGLFALSEGLLRQDPLSGHLFVFCNRRRTHLKILRWDGSGLCLYAKRLERGTFSWPGAQDEVVEFSSARLAMLLEGIDLGAARQRRWYRRGAENITK